MMNALVVGVLALMLLPRVLDALLGVTGDIHTEIDVHFALLVLCACATPPFLARLCHSLISKKAATQQIGLEFSKTLDRDLVQRAVASWRYEVRRNQGSQSRAESFAGLWGLMTTLVLAGAVTFLLPPFHIPRSPFTQTHNMVAFAVVGAASTRFLLDLARISVRISNDDASKRMFAEILQALILSVVATLAFMLISGLIVSKAPGTAVSGLTGVLQSMGTGAGVAIVGVPAFEYVVQKVSGVLGVARPLQPTTTPLSALMGITVTEIERLAEEGIESVECLVSTPVPRIFLNTRFSLARICDWIDKGLLLCRLGTTPAADLRGRTGVAGALELKQIATEGTDDRAVAIVAAVKKAMRIDSDDEARLVVSGIVFNDSVMMLATFRHTPLADGSATNDDAVPLPDPPKMSADADATVLRAIRSQ